MPAAQTDDTFLFFLSRAHSVCLPFLLSPHTHTNTSIVKKRSKEKNRSRAPHQPPKMDPKIKQRTIDHMNRDHQAELAHYLEYYSQVPSWVATSSPEMVDLTLEEMVVRAGDGRDHRISLRPALKTAADARRVLIDMDVVARAALAPAGGPTTLTEYRAPRGLGAAVFAGVTLYAVCWATLDAVVPGTTAWRLLADYWPGGVDVYRAVVQLLFWPVVVAHLAEAAIFDQVRMARYNVPRFSRLWFVWMLNCLVEGYPTFQRVDAVMKEKLQRGSKAH